MSSGTLAEIQNALGEAGTFQLRTGLLTVIPGMFCAMATYAHVFLGAVPNHRCFIAGCDPPPPAQPPFDAPWLSKAVPKKNDSNVLDTSDWDTCKMYNHTYTFGGMFGDTCDLDFDASDPVECSQWVYDDSEFISTVAMEWGLVCTRGAALNPLSQTLFFAGLYLGGFVFGTLGDLIGRRPNLAASMLLMGFLGTAVAFSPNYVIYLVLRFFVAAAAQGVYMTTFVLGIELVGPSKRSAFGVILSYFWAVGGVILVGVAWVTRRWRWLQVLISAPLLLCLFYMPWLPESIDWLLSRGKYEKAIRIIEWVERVNNKTVPQELKDALRPKEVSDDEENQPEEKKGSFRTHVAEIVTSGILVRRALIIFYLWIAVNFIFYGLSLNAALIGGSLYLNFLALTVVEIPAYTAAWFLMDFWGRKYGMALSFAIGGVATVIAAATSSLDMYWMKVALSSIGKAGGTSAYSIIYVYTAELFPTPLRSVTMTSAALVARIGAMVSPYMGLLATVWAPLPLYAFGVLSLLGAALTMLLVETRGLPMPQTTEEAENLGKKQPGTDEAANNKNEPEDSEGGEPEGEEPAGATTEEDSPLVENQRSR